MPMPAALEYRRSPARAKILRIISGSDAKLDDPPSHEQGRDRPARVHESVGDVMHAVEPRHDPHRARETLFARQLGAMLGGYAARNDFDRLVLVAPAVMLGDLRCALQPQVLEKVVAEVDKDLKNTESPYRHTNAGDGEIDRLPMVLVAREDAGRMARLLASGQKLYADLSIPNSVGGPITAANVVAELRGSEKPDEFVILGAHLDSWDLGTGALDNGCNAALVVDALRAIKASGVRPRRTIRFILFSGEEEGMVGSHAYTTSHREELDKIAGVVIFDSGIGRVTGFSLGGRRDVINAATALVAPLKSLDATTLTTDADWGTDNFDFLLQGVPTFVANQEEGNYLLNYHAMSDTFDKVDLAELRKHVVEASALTVGLANASAVPGPRLHHAQIEQTLVETHLADQLKTFGPWSDWESGKRGRKD